MKRVIRRILALMPAILIQATLLFALMTVLSPYEAGINLALRIIAVLFVLYINTKVDEGAYKIIWLLTIMTFPALGVILYAIVGNKRTARPLMKKVTKAEAALPRNPETDPEIMAEIKKQNPRLAQTYELLIKSTNAPVMRNKDAKYYALGDDMWLDMMEDMKKAEKYIFLEYFIVHEGEMLNEMVKIMAEKVKEGVDVRFMYDDFGSITTFSADNARYLRSLGIKCVIFNELHFLSGTINNRDHRKMLIIDGKVAYTGGVNLADEYVNKIERFGHWKDGGVRITGAPVSSYVRMYSEFWNAFSGIPVLNSYINDIPEEDGDDGYVLSYYDSPTSPDAVSNNLFVELLDQATYTAWFYTPYLLPGDILLAAFRRAAARGVDVRIVMPGIPDKALVYRLSRSYYEVLLKVGVKIYEYTPGFLHTKACVIDGNIGAIGTVNLDYRSLYLHFENNSFFYKAKALDSLKQDFEETMKKCRQVGLADAKHNALHNLIDGALRIIAPLC